MKEEVRKAVRDEQRIRRKLQVLNYARIVGNAAEACRLFNVPNTSFYEWKDCGRVTRIVKLKG